MWWATLKNSQSSYFIDLSLAKTDKKNSMLFSTGNIGKTRGTGKTGKTGNTDKIGKTGDTG